MDDVPDDVPDDPPRPGSFQPESGAGFAPPSVRPGFAIGSECNCDPPEPCGFDSGAGNGFSPGPP
ncbi:hypothetical protein ACIO6U_29325, partial [Streptomyces sp. NPDC087422]|uniref:hypothetical protein n=1 Tax=Streptomyces sp. NPDC087422 TaxID=3365786 RepID=UPI0037F8A2A4